MVGVVICQCRGRGFFNQDDIGKLYTYIRENHDVKFICEHPYLCSPKVGLPFLDSLLKNDRIITLACYQRTQKWLFNPCKGDLVPFNIRDLKLKDVIDELKRLLPEKKTENNEEINEWFPVIDYDRCTGCGSCIEFCVFGVYGPDADTRKARVVNPYNCRNNCPACARDCPEEAIIMAKSPERWVAGGEREGSSVLVVSTVKDFEYPGRAKKVSNIPNFEDRERIRELILTSNSKEIIDCADAVGMKILTQLNLTSIFLDFTIAELKTHVLSEEFSKIPYNKRVLIVSHCLRDAEKCRNHYEPLENGLQLICENCGSDKCKVNPIVKVAKELGYNIYISEGATVALKMLKERKADGFFAVACLDSLMKARPIAEILKIPGGGLPLLQSGCINTDVEVDKAIERIRSYKVVP
ncbi:Electron transport complex subunit RsxB [uncultured archaeon]|nr:Electron transport complex subunit RsxB [uncultured archaeon]